MIGLETARKLKEAGLTWQPLHGDRFVAPDRNLDDLVFVVNDMATIIEMWQGAPAVTFHGTPEWALDYLYLGETLWLPHESQLRELLRRMLAEAGSDTFDLLYADGSYTCRFAYRDEAVAFRADTAEEAYAAALLHLRACGAPF
jgi:hypothetical protein